MGEMKDIQNLIYHELRRVEAGAFEAGGGGSLRSPTLVQPSTPYHFCERHHVVLDAGEPCPLCADPWGFDRQDSPSTVPSGSVPPYHAWSRSYRRQWWKTLLRTRKES
jgi:hypothetical protein